VVSLTFGKREDNPVMPLGDFAADAVLERRVARTDGSRRSRPSKGAEKNGAAGRPTKATGPDAGRDGPPARRSVHAIGRNAV